MPGGVLCDASIGCVSPGKLVIGEPQSTPSSLSGMSSDVRSSTTWAPTNGPMKVLLKSGATAVDMETAAVAAVCERKGTPYAVFRAISDYATDGSVDAACRDACTPG